MNKQERQRKINILKEIDNGNSKAIKELLPSVILLQSGNYFEYKGKSFHIDQLPEFKKKYNISTIIELIDSSKPLTKTEQTNL